MAITPEQKEIIEGLNDPLYTVEFLEEWINRNDNVFTNPAVALQAMGAKGFYSAVKALETYLTPQKPENSKEFVFADYENGASASGNVVIYHCPKCGGRVGADFRPIGSRFSKDSHCRICGKAIDWNGENE